MGLTSRALWKLMELCQFIIHALFEHSPASSSISCKEAQPTLRSPTPTSAKAGSPHHWPTEHSLGINPNPCSLVFEQTTFCISHWLPECTTPQHGAEEGLGGLHCSHQNTAPCTGDLNWAPTWETLGIPLFLTICYILVTFTPIGVFQVAQNSSHHCMSSTMTYSIKLPPPWPIPIVAPHFPPAVQAGLNYQLPDKKTEITQEFKQ